MCARCRTQIEAVYGEMLPRQPLRFLLADDPGAGKTIMAGLYMKELMLRGALERALVVVPGNLTAQWQEELRDKFDLHFDVVTKDDLDAIASVNVFERKRLLIARVDQIARRREELEPYLRRAEWDLVVVDEAHRMAAHFWGGEIRKTLRYQLGELLGATSQHLLLMTATPHNGKEEDFQLFCALLDGDQFAGRFRDGVHATDPSGFMRRMVKERLLTFEGRPLFPRAAFFDGSVSAVGCGDGVVRRGDVVRPRADERGGQDSRERRRSSGKHGGVRTYGAAAAAGIVSRGDLSVVASASRSSGRPDHRGAASGASVAAGAVGPPRASVTPVGRGRR